MYEHLKIAVVIPCYRVKRHVLDVIARVPAEVDLIVCVDDACTEASGQLIEERCSDPRVTVLYNENNLGVGGAVKAGYVAARAAGCDVAVKIDGDGQMDPRQIPSFLHPISVGICDYTKGNRFFRIEDARAMPRVRLFGNAILSFFAKLSTGYWTIFDPTNGYTALHLSVLELVSLDKVADRYFFETDLLFRLNVARCAVRDVPMIAHYGDEQSGLSATNVMVPFLAGHVRNLMKRLFYTYFLRDFHVASVQLLIGPPLFLAGVIFGGYHWWLSFSTGALATPGTVMMSALMVLSGLQLSLSAMSYDMTNAPKEAVHPILVRSGK